ncbi:hypothetical protein HZB03_01745 [Candidatus Woesearchaeota archaeon]|nr:hypothetical protein [Candidatus Woesearchaeota archaeon]
MESTKENPRQLPIKGVLHRNRMNVKNRIIMEGLLMKYFDMPKLQRSSMLRKRT